MNRPEHRYHGLSRGGGDVTDVLVRDVPDDVVAALDARASRLGLSRSEFLRRRLAQEAATGPEPVTVEHLAAFAETFADLNDAEIMKGAWE
jgi:plasmid stability protein